MSDTARMREVAASAITISDKIRALDRAGYARADIARFLDRRYQQVRNVLEGDKHAGASVTEGSQARARRRDTNLAEHRLVTSSDNGARSARPPTTAAPADEPPALRLQTDADGSLRVPTHLLQALGIELDTVVIGFVTSDSLTLLSPAAAMRRAQGRVRALIPGQESLSASLLEGRRREGERNRQDG